MKYKFIPVNNNINKAVAFANTLDANNIKNVQRIKTKEFYIPTIEAIKKLQDEGWVIKGVAEHRAKNRKITTNYAQLHHPDFEVVNKKGKSEAVSSLTITNSCDGKSPLTMDLGFYREVCSNGAIMFDKHGESTEIKHTEVNFNNLQNFINSVNSKSDKVLERFGIYQNKHMTVEQAREFASKAARLKHRPKDITPRMVENLLQVNRREDEGDNLWSVFNRVQESLTEGVNNFNLDIRLNKQLSSLTEQYALAN